MTGPVRPYDAATDEAWATSFLDDHLGGRWQARRGELIDVLDPGLGFVMGEGSGLLTFRLDDPELELTAVAAAPRGTGTGTALLDAFLVEARRLRVAGIWVVTTNDNLEAVAFYQRRGFRLRTLRAGAVDEARRTLKPAIPAVGQHGIEMHDELELSLVLSSD